MLLGNIGKQLAIVFVSASLMLAGCQNDGTKDQTGSAGGEPAVSVSPSPTPAAGSEQASASPQPSPSAQAPAGTGSASKPSPEAKTPKGTVTAVRMADAKSGWTGGAGWIARTDDGGHTWQVQYGGDGTVKQIFALNGNDAWALMDSSNLLHTTDGGKHWSSSGKAPGTAFLHFRSNTEAYSGNAVSSDGGKTWSTLTVPEHIVGDAYFHDARNGWAVTQTQTTVEIQRTDDGGKSWKAVMKRDIADPINGALIRSTGTDDAWVELIGGSGMTQTSYSLFHTADGGKQWQTVIAKNTAGGGPAPGFPMDYSGGPSNEGSSPGMLYVVSPQVAFMGGECQACDKPNTIGWTTDGGKTWVNGSSSFEGYGEQQIAAVDASNAWWICTDHEAPSVLYTTSDGGKHWEKAYTFK